MASFHPAKHSNPDTQKALLRSSPVGLPSLRAGTGRYRFGGVAGQPTVADLNQRMSSLGLRIARQRHGRSFWRCRLLRHRIAPVTGAKAVYFQSTGDGISRTTRSASAGAAHHISAGGRRPRPSPKCGSSGVLDASVANRCETTTMGGEAGQGAPREGADQTKMPRFTGAILWRFPAQFPARDSCKLRKPLIFQYARQELNL